MSANRKRSANIELVVSKRKNTLGEKCEFEWDLTNLDQIKAPIRTPIFTVLENLDTKFYFEVWCHGFDRYETQTNSSLHIVLKKLPQSLVQTDLQFHLFVYVHCSNGSLYSKYESQSPITLSDFTAKTCISEISHANNTHAHVAGRSNCLVLKCEMIFYGHLLSHSEIYFLHNLREITKGFESLYQSNAFSDVSFRIGDKTLRSHKFVLAATSPVFKIMLEQDFLESKTGIIKISDFEPEVFEAFLKFLYTGEVEMKSFSDIKQLYSLADKYVVQILKKVCIKMWTGTRLSEEEILEIRQMAHEYEDDTLKSAYHSFLTDHFYPFSQ